MSKRLIILILLLAGGLALILALLLWLGRGISPAASNFNASQPVSNANLNTPSNTNVNAPQAPQPPAAPPEKTGAQLKEELKRLGLIFTEKFGSFSSQSNLNNISELYDVMTDTMRRWAENYIVKTRQSNTSAKTYQSIITRVVSWKYGVFDEKAGKAEITFTTQREESQSLTGPSNTYYQDFKLDFLKDGETWKIDGAYWQPKK